MSVILFLDTETTGTPLRYDAPETDVPNWPRVVQVAWAVLPDGDAPPVAYWMAGAIVRPVGFVIPAEAAAIHGITTELAERHGNPLGHVLEWLESSAVSCDTLVCHNVAFDAPVLGAEYVRLGRPSPLGRLRHRCTMREAADHWQCKWPRLEELHARLFGAPHDGRHSAAGDVEALIRCWYELRRLGVVRRAE